MKFSKLDSLKKYADGMKEPFANQYKGFNKVAHSFAYFGHFAIISIAFIYVAGLLREVEQSIPVWVAYLIAISFLLLFELLKRVVVNKFAFEHAKSGFSFASPAVIGLLGATLVLNGISFYLTFSGADRFSNKSDTIAYNSEADIKMIKDSLRAKYEGEIEEVEVRYDEIDERNQKISEENSRLNRTRTWNNAHDEQYKLNLETIEENKGRMDELKQEIVEIEKERDKIIQESVSQIETNQDRKSNRNKDNYMAFIIMSIAFELFISLGLYFGVFYQYRAARDYERRRANDPNYRRYQKWRKILEVIYDDSIGADENQPLPTTKELLIVLKARGVYSSQKELNNDFFRFISALNIIETRGGKRYLPAVKEDAFKKFESQFES